MREILFKAKRIDNGEWVEGYLFETNENSYIAYNKQFNDDLFLSPHNIFIEIDRNTICQYTGLTDKNGNKIWENDILQWTREDIVLVSSPYHEGYRLGDKVKVKKLDSGFTLLALKNNSEAPNIIGNVKNYEFWNMQRFLKVIGNIFDNADLLKGE